MTNTACISIAQTLDATTIKDRTTFPYDCVVDLRSGTSGKAVAMEERTIKKLANFFVDYQQHPCSTDHEAMHGVLEKINVTEGHALVLTDKVATLRQACDEAQVLSRIMETDAPKFNVIEQTRSAQPDTAPDTACDQAVGL